MAKTAANLANFPYRSIYFYVNNPKTADEIFSPETIFFFLTLFRGGVTCFNKIIYTFANVNLRKLNTIYYITIILKQNKHEEKKV